MIIYLEFKYGLNYIPSKQPKNEAGIDQDKGLKKQDLRHDSSYHV